MSAAELLLSKGADVNAVDDDWWTPLHMACSCDSVEVLQLLLNVSTRNANTIKILKIRILEKIAVITLKFEHGGFTIE